MYTTHLILITHYCQTPAKHIPFQIHILFIYFESIYFYMYKYFTCRYVCAAHAYLFPKEGRRWYWSPGTGVTYGPEMSFMWHKLNLGPLLNIAYSVCIMLFVHVFSELSLWHGTTNWYALAWGNLPLLLSVLSVSYSSLHRIVACGIFFHSPWDANWYHSC